MGKAAWAALGVGALLVAERRARGALARRSRLLSTRLGPVEVEVTGAGPDVLVLHGSGGGFDQGTWLARALDLRAQRVIAVSRPGYLRTPDRETLDEAVELYVATLDALGVERAAVLGGSGGGMSAAVLAARHPERVSALVMLSAVSGPVTEAGASLALYMARATLDLNTTVVRAVRRRSHLALLLELASTLAAPDQRVRGVLRDLAISRSFVAQRVSVPTLVIHGTADRAVAFAHAERTQAGCADSELVAIEGGGHLCCLTHAEVGERIRAFLAAHSAHVTLPAAG